MKKLIMALVLVPTLILSVPDNQLMSVKYDEDKAFKKLSGNFDMEYCLDSRDELYYKKAIDFIKLHEGYANGDAYYCVSGKLTIGYGHVIIEGDNLPDHITMEEADQLLRDDFSKARKLADGIYPEMKGSRKIAITHFIFSKGIGAFLRSGLKKKIDANGDVDEEFAKWCYFKCAKSGNMVYSKVAANIQKWEAEMWHADDDLYLRGGVI